MASVISRYVAPYAWQITKFADKAKKKLISKIVIVISKAVQKSLRYFNGTAISTSRATPSSVNFDLDLNDLESAMLWPGSALQYCSKLTDVFEKVLLQSAKIYIGNTTSGSLAIHACVLLI